MSHNQIRFATDDSDDINYERTPIPVAWWLGSMAACVAVFLGCIRMGWHFFWSSLFALCVLAYWACLAKWAYNRHAIERSTSIKAVAEKLGLDYRPLAPSEMLQGVAETRLFDNYPLLRAENVLTGTFLGKSIKVFDLHASDPSRGENGSEFSISVVTFPDEILPAPDFELRPLRVIRRFARMFDGSGVKLSGTILKDQFASRYDLRGERKSEIRALFEGPVTAYFAQRSGWVVQCVNQKLFVWREGPGSHDKLLTHRHFQLTTQPRMETDGNLVATDEVVRLLERALYIRELFAQQCTFKGI